MILFHRLAFDKKYIVLKGEPRFNATYANIMLKFGIDRTMQYA